MPRSEKIISNNNILAKWPSSGCNTKSKHNDYIQGRSRVRDGVKEENCMGQFESGKIVWQSTHRYKPLSVNISCKLIQYSTLRTVSCVKSRSITTTVRSLSVQIGWNVRIMSVCLTVCLSIMYVVFVLQCMLMLYVVSCKFILFSCRLWMEYESMTKSK